MMAHFADGHGTSVCSTAHLYHYLLGGPESVPAILQRGLLPLSALPESPRFQQMRQWSPTFYEDLYASIALPLLRQPYRNSGIYFTPIDFRRLPDLRPATLTRIAVPLAAFDAGRAVLTYAPGDERVILPLTPQALEATAQLWDAAMVRAWFGRDRQRLFWHVPQVAVYPDEAIAVEPDWVEPGHEASPPLC